VLAANESFSVLTDEIVARARCADTVDRVVLRCRKRGLELHLYRTGKAARWYARPTIKGRQHRLNLGTLEARPTVAEAHAALAEELLKADRHGTVAIEDRSTFAGLVDDFLADFRKRKRTRSTENYENALTRFALPALGQKKLRQIRRADLVDCIDQTYDALVGRGLKGSEVATLRAAIQSVWRWGMTKGRVELDLVARLPTPVANDPRATVYSDEQLVVMWDATTPGAEAPISNLMAAAFRAAMVTAQRIGAVMLTRANDLDLVAATWTIRPMDGTKVKTLHVVPLPPMALEAWRSALAISDAQGDQPVFPADRGRTSKAETLRQDSASNAMSRLRTQCPALGAVTLHDLRRTARTRISGKCHREDAERWLGHVIGTQVERVYDQDQHLDEKRKAAMAWESYLSTVLKRGC
jgi:integrase